MVASASTTATLPAGAGEESHLKGYPLVLVCGRGEQVKMAYLSDISADGEARYRSADNKLALVVARDKTVGSPMTVPEGSVCLDKTLDQLRDEGRTIEALQ